MKSIALFLSFAFLPSLFVFANPVARVVPMPKHVDSYKLPKLSLEPKNLLIVYGAKSLKTRIGAEEINKELFRLGFTQKASLVADKDFKLSDNVKLLALIGNAEENSVTRAYQKRFTRNKDVSKIKKKQGYVIDFSPGQPPIAFLNGVGEQGSLYAAVTFAQMIERNGNQLNIQPVFISDWPDFNFRFMTFFYDNRIIKKDEFSNKKLIIDWMTRHKMNVVGVKFSGGTELPKANAYAKERGIHPFVFYRRGGGSYTTIGYEKEAEKILGKEKVAKYSNIYNKHGKKGVISWSDNEHRAPYINSFVEECKADGINMAWFHNTDTGLSRFNYSLWKDRDEMDKKSFGNDYGKAESHVINFIYKRCQKINPGMKTVFVIYPYTPAVLSDDFPYNIQPDINKAYAEKEKVFIKRFFATLAKELPQSVYTLQRENTRENMERWMEVTRHPCMFYFEVEKPGFSFFNTRARYIKTFYFPNYDYDNIYFATLVYTSCFPFVSEPMQVLSHAEYSWNVNQKNSANFKPFDFKDDLTSPSWILETWLPRALNAYWGADSGKYFLPLYKSGIVPGFIENPDRFRKSLHRKFTATLEETGNITRNGGSEMFYGE
jgi:hypothetical protein